MRAAILALLGTIAAEAPILAQEISISVRDTVGRPVYSTVYFRPSASADWNRLGVTEPNGVLKAPLSCAPGMEIYADPFPGEYWSSRYTACRAPLPLEVKPRHDFVLSELLKQTPAGSEVAASRIDFAQAVGQAEAREFRNMSGPNALDAYLVSSNALPPATAAKIEMNLLNESSAFYAMVDDNRDGALTRAEISSALADLNSGMASPR